MGKLLEKQLVNAKQMLRRACHALDFCGAWHE